MEKFPKAALDKFSSRIAGALVLPSDPRYEKLKKPWLRIVEQHPAMIVEAVNTSDIVQAVNFARENQLPLGVQSTGHGIAKPCNGGLLLNIHKMNGVSIDTANQSATVQGGTTWTDLLQKARPYGLVAPSGQVGSVGVAGYTLGGGVGWLVRKYGAASDYLVSATVVLASGEVVKANAQEHTDLLWALRGGGGNFGVVASMELQMVEETDVVAGLRWYPIDQASILLRAYRDWAAQLTHETSTIFRLTAVPDEPDFPESIRGKAACVIGLCHADPETSEKVVASLGKLGEAVLDQVHQMHYIKVSDLDPASHESSAQTYSQLAYLANLNNDTIDRIVKMAQSEIPPLFLMEIQQLGGKFSEGEHSEGSFCATRSPFALHLVTPPVKGSWGEIAKDTQKTFEKLSPSLSGELMYNFLRSDEQERIADAFEPEDFNRLQALKKRYDPKNLFHLNLNIPPS